MIDVISSSPVPNSDYLIWHGDVTNFLERIPEAKFDLVVTSPPYNIGKSYETKVSLQTYLDWQQQVIDKIVPFIKDTGSICWQVGNFVDDGEIIPLDIVFDPIFRKHGLRLRNRIVWHFGHGLHCSKRFSGRYETILWYSKTKKYTFNLDNVRVPSKYPGKKHFKGPKKGQLSGNPLGKNPSDVWDIPNVKNNHSEKTEHPCQFPVGLVERLVLSLTNPGGLVFDPFAGVCSAGVAAAVHKRKFWGCEIDEGFIETGRERLKQALNGSIRYRRHDVPIYDPNRGHSNELVCSDTTKGSTQSSV